MNPMMRRMVMSGGMGDVYSDTRPRTVGTPLPTAPVGHSTRDAIFGAIGLSLQTINNIFAPRATPLLTAPAPVTYQQPASTQYAPQTDELASAGATSGGIRIGNTTISWPMIAIAVLAFYLLQSRGFTRR
jgi:hypothetical protein